MFFLFDQAVKLLMNTNINKHTIVLVKDKILPYNLIYTLSSVELKTFKAYIKTQSKIIFIQYSKFSIKASYFFDKKTDSSFSLYVNH